MCKGSVVVAMSGGVDSSLAAALLKNQGFQVMGAFMEVFDESISELENDCHACFGPDEKNDLKDARAIAEKLKIPFYALDLKEKYRKKILDFFVSEYLKGNTPNPCTKCNQEMKFEAIVEELNKREINFDYFATGHYAQIESDPRKNITYLKKAADQTKDQSYFLYRFKSHQLKRIIFPLGKYKKEDVRRLAKELKLGVSEKVESQDFIAGGYHQLFKNAIIPGSILNTRGEVIGEHRGIVFYTIGQRKGIGISSSKPLYVIAKNEKNNTITVGTRDRLLGTNLIAKELNWINFDQLTTNLNIKARIRYQHKEAVARIIPIEKKKVLVKFQEPQLAITPGQAVVFYNEDVVVGGGIIEKEVKHEYK